MEQAVDSYFCTTLVTRSRFNWKLSTSWTSRFYIQKDKTTAVRHFKRLQYTLKTTALDEINMGQIDFLALLVPLIYWKASGVWPELKKYDLLFIKFLNSLIIRSPDVIHAYVNEGIHASVKNILALVHVAVKQCY